MEPLEAELSRARELAVDDLADAIEAMGFECTRCGGCCTGYAPDEPGGAPAGEGADPEADAGCHDADADGDGAGTDGDGPDREPHTATVFPDEVREVAAAAEERFGESYDWRDVARPMPFGLSEDDEGEPAGETFEWALATDDCGDCAFYEESDGKGACTVHDSRPLICRTYPFSVALDGTSQPMGEAVDAEGIVRAHECEGLGRDISREDAEALAASLKERAVRELEEAIGVRDNYDPDAAERADGDVVVFDSEGPKEADGTPVDGD
jgi:Fe-S-cluster containining protein